MAACRGIRGATTAEDNTKEAIFSATKELFRGIVEANQIEEAQVAAAFFTTTHDLNAAFPPRLCGRWAGTLRPSCVAMR